MAVLFCYICHKFFHFRRRDVCMPSLYAKWRVHERSTLTTGFTEFLIEISEFIWLIYRTPTGLFTLKKTQFRTRTYWFAVVNTHLGSDWFVFTSRGAC